MKRKRLCSSLTPLRLAGAGGMECARQTSINTSLGRNSEAFSSSPLHLLVPLVPPLLRASGAVAMSTGADVAYTQTLTS
jgi:hypothetical protein